MATSGVMAGGPDQSKILRGCFVLWSATMRRARAGLSRDAGEARPSRPCSAIKKARALSGGRGLSQVGQVRTRCASCFSCVEDCRRQLTQRLTSGAWLPGFQSSSEHCPSEIKQRDSDRNARPVIPRRLLRSPKDAPTM
jgi:hypothetical protein